MHWSSLPIFGDKQAKRESILRVEKVAFCLVEGATQGLAAVWNAQTYTVCPIGWGEGKIRPVEQLSFFPPNAPHFSFRKRRFAKLHKTSCMTSSQVRRFFCVANPVSLLLRRKDNDISHVYAVLIWVDHVLNADKSPEPDGLTKEEARSTCGKLPKALGSH